MALASARARVVTAAASLAAAERAVETCRRELADARQHLTRLEGASSPRVDGEGASSPGTDGSVSLATAPVKANGDCGDDEYASKGSCDGAFVQEKVHPEEGGGDNDMSSTKRKRQSLTEQSSEKSSDDRCSVAKCRNRALGGGKCRRHGGKKVFPTCNHEGCSNQARRGTACDRHSRVRTCKRPGCVNAWEKNGLCTVHSGNNRCHYEGCSRYKRQGGYCISHAKELGLEAKNARKICREEGCSNVSQNNGKCERHGARVRFCSVEGCEARAKTGGFAPVCIRHGAKVKRKLCTHPSCSNQAKKGGLCYRHRDKSTPEESKDEPAMATGMCRDRSFDVVEIDI